MGTHFLTVTPCVIHASSYAQLFIHTTHLLAPPLPLSSLCFSSACIGHFLSCNSWMLNDTQACLGLQFWECYFFYLNNTFSSLIPQSFFFCCSYFSFNFIFVIVCFIHLNVSYYALLSWISNLGSVTLPTDFCMSSCCFFLFSHHVLVFVIHCQFSLSLLALFFLILLWFKAQVERYQLGSHIYNWGFFFSFSCIWGCIWTR